jgi:tetrahydromethanopterin S-methyltransferase subunit B
MADNRSKDQLASDYLTSAKYIDPRSIEPEGAIATSAGIMTAYALTSIAASLCAINERLARLDPFVDELLAARTGEKE